MLTLFQEPLTSVRVILGPRQCLKVRPYLANLTISKPDSVGKGPSGVAIHPHYALTARFVHKVMEYSSLVGHRFSLRLRYVINFDVQRNRRAPVRQAIFSQRRPSVLLRALSVVKPSID